MSKSTRKTSRFNPAYAGNIGSSDILTAPGQVQPRVCGEYLILEKMQIYVPGSTPRMRGICYTIKYSNTIIRFNPAYAGNIDPSRALALDLQVQPRVCGEYVDVKDWYDNLTGSTPRMRGI